MGNLKSLFNKAGRKIQSASTRETPSTNDNESNISITSIIENDEIYITNNNSDKTAFTERNVIVQEKGNHGKVRKNTKFCQDALLAGSLASTFASKTGSKLLAAAIDDSKAIDDNIFRNFEYPFTNLVFEGGGNKGMAYVGALQVRFFLMVYIIVLLICLFVICVNIFCANSSHMMNKIVNRIKIRKKCNVEVH